LIASRIVGNTETTQKWRSRKKWLAYTAPDWTSNRPATSSPRLKSNVPLSPRAAVGLPVYNAGAMNLSRTARLLLALVSGVTLALAFPIFNLPLLVWISLAILILAVLGATPRYALLLGWLQGAVFYALSVPWFYGVMRQYGPLPVVAAGGVFLLVVFACAVFHAAFAFGVAWFGRFGAAQACLAAPFLWVSMEFLLLHLPHIGFPWNLLGYAAAGNLAFVQLTAITGIFGLSLLVAAYNALLAWAAVQLAAEKLPSFVGRAFSSRRRKDRHDIKPELSSGVSTPDGPIAHFSATSQAAHGNQRALWISLFATIVLAAVALAGPRFVPQAPADHIAHLVQTNFPVSMNYPKDWMQTHASELDELEQISIGAARKIPGLVIWPEVPAPFVLQEAPFLTRAQRIARGAAGGFLVGVEDLKPLPNHEIGVTNSAALLGSSGELDFLYDKIHLVPFSEYVPWRKWLFFARDLTGLVGDFQHGSQYKVGHFPGGPFSVFICYEAIFPNEVRRFTLAGAALLVNISDDGWFGGSSAPPQHLAMARVRAVENRRWLLRDTNTGITVSVDPYGRIVARLPADTRGELDAPYGFRTDLTPYARWGDWLAWLCVIATLVLLLLSARDAFARRTP
jgi:apolipoprotein N-acyltransferase